MCVCAVRTFKVRETKAKEDHKFTQKILLKLTEGRGFTYWPRNKANVIWAEKEGNAGTRL